MERTRTICAVVSAAVALVVLWRVLTCGCP